MRNRWETSFQQASHTCQGCWGCTLTIKRLATQSNPKWYVNMLLCAPKWIIWCSDSQLISRCPCPKWHIAIARLISFSKHTAHSPHCAGLARAKSKPAPSAQNHGRYWELGEGHHGPERGGTVGRMEEKVSYKEERASYKQKHSAHASSPAHSEAAFRKQAFTK